MGRSKPPIREWLRQIKKTDPEAPYETPIWLGSHSNGEYFHQQTRQERRLREVILKEGAERAKRYGMDRREFMASGLGMAFTMSMVNMVNGCSSDGSGGGLNPANGVGQPAVPSGPPPAAAPPTAGGPPAVAPPPTGQPPVAPPPAGGPQPTPGSGMGMSTGQDGMMDDPVECATALDYTDMFIFDVQTHRVESAPGIYSGFLQFLPQGRCGLGVPECYSKDEYIREMFLESNTTMTLLSGIPATDGANPLTNHQIAETRDYVSMLASDSQRVVTHAMVLPNYNTQLQLDGMAQLAQEVAPIAAWKCYTPWGPGNGVSGFWMDDPDTGIAMIERGREIGVKVFCCHKGLPLPGFDNRYGDPKDIGVVAARYPDTTFVVYHSAYEYAPDGGDGAAAESQPYVMGSRAGSNSLVTACLDNGIGPGGNVYAELGSTWFRIMTNTTVATHLLGKMLKYLGEDNIVWGTDCMWYGSPQPQIQAFMSFTMDEQIRAANDYPELTMQAKEKIMGLNAAKVFGVDPTGTRCGIAESALSTAKRDLDAEFGKFRWALNGPRMTTRREFMLHDKLCRFIKSPG